MKELSFKYLSYPTPVFCIGTYDDRGRANLMTAVLGGMCSHDPPYFAISLRAATQTHGNIAKRGAFSVNVPSGEFVSQVDYVGLVSGTDADKFAACGLTAVPGAIVEAPYVGEFPTVAECEVRHTMDLGSHTMFIGEIRTLRANEDVLTEVQYGGRTVADVPDMVKAGGITLTVMGTERSYVGLGTNHGKAYSIGRTYVKDR